jgi:hypothetical protein
MMRFGMQGRVISFPLDCVIVICKQVPSGKVTNIGEAETADVVCTVVAYGFLLLVPVQPAMAAKTTISVIRILIIGRR